MKKLDKRQVWRRLDTRQDNVLEVQTNIAIEDLVLRHYSLVHEWCWTLKTKDELNVSEVVNSLVKSLEELTGVKTTTYTSDERPDYSFLGKDIVVTLRPNWQADWDELTDTEVPTGACPSIEITAYYVEPILLERLKNICRGTKLQNPLAETASGLVPVTFAFPGGEEGVKFKRHTIERLPLDSIIQNYQPEVIEMAKDLIDRSGDTSHGMVIISGEVGTGKSFLIRALISEIRKRQAIVCSPPIKFLREAGLLSQACSRHRRSMIVLEDIGEVIANDAPTYFTDARSNLLNITEGLLSLLMDSIIIISFNYAISKLDPAVIRDGRCLAQITTKDLSYKQAQSLLDFEVAEKEYSLAEVYEMIRLGKEKSEKKESTMGFLQR